MSNDVGEQLASGPGRAKAARADTNLKKGNMSGARTLGEHVTGTIEGNGESAAQSTRAAVVSCLSH